MKLENYVVFVDDSLLFEKGNVFHIYVVHDQIVVIVMLSWLCINNCLFYQTRDFPISPRENLVYKCNCYNYIFEDLLKQILFLLIIRTSWSARRFESAKYEDFAGSVSASPVDALSLLVEEEPNAHNDKMPIEGVQIKTEVCDFEISSPPSSLNATGECNPENEETAGTNEPNLHSSQGTLKLHDKLSSMENSFGGVNDVERKSSNTEDAFGALVSMHLKDVRNKKKRNSMKLQIVKILLEGDQSDVEETE